MAIASVSYTFAPSTLAVGSEVNTNFSDLVSFLNGSVIHKDASVAFTGVPSGPSTDPISDDQFARKAYVDKLGIVSRVELTSNSSDATSSTGTTTQILNVPVIEDYWYAIHFHSAWSLIGSGRWDTYLQVNGSNVGRFDVCSGTSVSGFTDSTVWWQAPATASTDDFEVYMSEVSGTATYRFDASSTSPRTLTVVSYGLL